MPYEAHRAYSPFEVISLFSGHIRWGPLIQKHLPERVLQQFGYVQTIPAVPTDPSGLPLTVEQIDDRWVHFSEYLIERGELAAFLYQCAAEYMEWFFNISHPFMIPTADGDAPRQPPVVDDPVPPMPYTHDPVHEDMLRHATVVCQRIAGILQDVIDQRMVAPDTEVH